MKSGIYFDGRYWERQVSSRSKSSLYCPHCSRPVYKTDTDGYFAQCFLCDEDFYSFELESAGESGKRFYVGRCPEGISLNSGLGYEVLQDEDGLIVFDSVESAQTFLLSKGVKEDDLDLFYYLDADVQDELNERYSEEDED